MSSASDVANESRNPILGIVMVLTAVLLFAGMDASTKHLTQTYSVPMIMAFRYGMGTLILLVILLPHRGRSLFSWQRPWVVLARAGVMVAASVMTAFALRWLPVAQTTAIVHLAPFGVLLLAGPILGEKVGLSSWLAAVFGFAGLLLIVRPGGGLDPTGVALALSAAVGAMWYYLFTRMLAGSESTEALLFAVNLVGAITFGLAMPWTFTPVLPSLFDLGVLLFAGTAALVGHYLLTAAYREATAALLAPLYYMHLIWAGLLGWLLFGDIPDLLATMGIALIAASGASLAIWTQISRRFRLRHPVA